MSDNEKRDLLLNQIFPPHVTELLVQNKPVPAELFRDVTVMFVDIVNFTNICSACASPLQVHKLQHDFYLVLDHCLSYFPRLYKVETIGDALMVIGGAPLHLYECTSDITR